MSYRQGINSTSLFQEVLRVKKELTEKDTPEMWQRRASPEQADRSRRHH